jgi:hypothetical protein
MLGGGIRALEPELVEERRIPRGNMLFVDGDDLEEGERSFGLGLL